MKINIYDYVIETEEERGRTTFCCPYCDEEISSDTFINKHFWERACILHLVKHGAVYLNKEEVEVIA